MSSSSKAVCVHLARYNRRANSEIYRAVSRLSDDDRAKNTGSWFGSLHGLLNHVLVADLYWLARFKAVYAHSEVLSDARLRPANLSWKHYLCEGFSDMKEMRTFVDGRIVDWFEECPEERFVVPFEYADSAGTVRKAMSGEAFEFLFVHQVHHRGQVSQVLDSMGIANNVADNAAFLDGAPEG